MAGKMVEFPTNAHQTHGYLATPTAGKGPGILVIQEWWGLVPHIKAVADRFAAEGFAALAPDMYHGKTADEPDGAGKLFMALNIAQAEKDLRGAAKYLAGQSSTPKLGAVGFCMGGQLALFAGTVNGNVGAVVDFYGIHPNVKPDYSKLSGPVLGLFAEKDGSVTPQTAHAGPGLRRYVQSHVVEERRRPDIPSTDVEVDGIAELWYDDREAMAAAMATPAAKALHADGALFIGRIKTYTIEEYQIIPP